MLEPARLTRARRELQALLREVGDNDAEAFASLVELADWFQTEGVPATAEHLRTRGYSWNELARPLGVSRQAVRQRFKRTESIPHRTERSEAVSRNLT